MNKFLEKYINKIIVIFLFLGPLFDLITSISINIFKLNFNFIIIFKILFMLLLIYYLFFISKSNYKNKSIFYLVLLGIYSGISIGINIYYKDMSVLMYELQSLIRTIYFPVCLTCLFNIYDEKKFEINYKILGKILIIYLILIFIPLITNTGFDSYAYSKVGSVGWFNSANEIGGILSILYPFLLMYTFSFKNKFLNIGMILVTFYIYFSLGSKVPVLALLIIYSLYTLRYIIKLFKDKCYKRISIILLSIMLIFIGSIIIIPKTSFYKNIVIHLEFLEVDEISDLMDIEKIDHFIFSSRIKFMKETMKNYNESNILEKLFGIGYIENYGTDDINLKTIEMDYYDILFRNGIIGFILILLPLILLIINIVKRLKNDELIFNLIISTILILVLSLFSGHILISPSVSIYVAIVLLYFKEAIV